MKIEILLGVLLSVGFISCECTYQYGVYVKNSTGEDLKIAYKSLVDVNGIVEEIIVLRDGESKRIIWTTDIRTDAGCSGTQPDHCKYVAEYITAFLKDTIQSKVKWCDKSIKFEKTDLEQAEFAINYTLDDFQF